MRKHLVKRVVLTMLALIAGFSISRAAAVNSSNWVTSALSVQKQADTTATPRTLSGSGNIDCAVEDTFNCSVPTNYGAATSNSTVRFNSSSSFKPVITYMDDRQHFYPVPNSDVAISYYSGPVDGLNLAFNYNFSLSIAKTGGTYTINRPPDGKLADKNKHPLAADILSASFSENGRWMVVSSPGLAILRINLQTFEVTPFAPGFNYNIGLDPAVKTAITNDGRYAVVSSNNFLTFKVYDISTCPAVPDTITGSLSCQSRDLRAFMQAAGTGFNFAVQARFMDDDTIATYVAYKTGTTNRTARYIISDNNQTHQQDLLALGDSYISGEGAFDYIGGTDTSSNKCHVSYLAYPFLIGRDLDYSSYHSVACSGAVTNDITNTSDNYTGQFDKTKRSERPESQVDSIIASFGPGYIDQLDFVKTYQPQVVTLSIGGNDMGFAEILKTCVAPAFPLSKNTCYNTYEDRLELVRQINTIVYPRLIHTYQQIKAAGPPDMRVYVIGYPQIAKPSGDCGLNVLLNDDEVLFSQEIINYLDTVVKAAATKAGVQYVDTQDALYGFRLCEAGPGAIAMNGLTAGNDRFTRFGGPIGDESYHPNSTGYQLIENEILSATHNLTSPMPLPASVALPPEAGLEILDVPHSGRTINTAIYASDMSPDLAYQQTPIDISISGSLATLQANSTLKAELHSTPISLGNLMTDSSGNLSAQVLIPSDTPTGYHTLHLYGTNLLGQPIDIYKVIYIAKSADDLDGDGVLDSTQKCIGVTPSGQDFDQDGIDDACDANITQPPPPTPTNSPTPNITTALEPVSASLTSAVKSSSTSLDMSEIFTDTSIAPQVKPQALSANYAGSTQTDVPTNNSSVKIVAFGSLLILLGAMLLFWRQI